MLKKVLAILFTAILVMGLGSPAFAAEDADIAKGLQLIEKTNKEIDKKIEKAVAKADQLQAEYLYDVRKIEEGDKVVKLKAEKEKTEAELDENKQDAGKVKKLNEKLAEIEKKLAEQQGKIQEKMNEIQRDIEEATLELMDAEGKDAKKLEEKIKKLNEKLNKRSEMYAEKTQRYTEKLEAIIKDVYDETLQMSAETIEKAEKYGVIAECEWKLVRFADQWVWIDPVRVVKFSK